MTENTEKQEEWEKLSKEEQIALCKKVEQEALEEMTREWFQRSDDFGRHAAQILLVGLLGILLWQTFFW